MFASHLSQVKNSSLITWVPRVKRGVNIWQGFVSLIHFTLSLQAGG